MSPEGPVGQNGVVEPGDHLVEVKFNLSYRCPIKVISFGRENDLANHNNRVHSNEPIITKSKFLQPRQSAGKLLRPIPAAEIIN